MQPPGTSAKPFTVFLLSVANVSAQAEGQSSRRGQGQITAVTCQGPSTSHKAHLAVLWVEWK